MILEERGQEEKVEITSSHMGNRHCDTTDCKHRSCRCVGKHTVCRRHASTEVCVVNTHFSRLCEYPKRQAGLGHPVLEELHM